MFLLLSCLNDWIIDIDGCNFSPEVFTLKMSVFIVVGQVRVGAKRLVSIIYTPPDQQPPDLLLFGSEWRCDAQCGAQFL